jgi:hypothetical protein
MSPLILGIMASSQPGATNSYESIETITAGAGGSSAITFSTIPSTYKHLQIRGIAQTTNNINPPENGKMTINGDTGNNYARHWVAGDGASASAAAVSSTGFIEFGFLNGGTTATSYIGFVIDLLDYTNTNKYKTVRLLSGFDKNGSGTIRLASGLWQNTNAITSVSFSSSGVYNLAQYSSFALYGIKG